MQHLCWYDLLKSKHSVRRRDGIVEGTEHMPFEGHRSRWLQYIARQKRKQFVNKKRGVARKVHGKTACCQNKTKKLCRTEISCCSPAKAAIKSLTSFEEEYIPWNPYIAERTSLEVILEHLLTSGTTAAMRERTFAQSDCIPAMPDWWGECVWERREGEGVCERGKEEEEGGECVREREEEGGWLDVV